MAINFPSSPTEGQVHNHVPGLSFIYRSGAWMKAPMTTALPKNYIGNPAMQIAQVNVDTAGQYSANGAWEAADRFSTFWNIPGASMRVARTAGDTSTSGSKVINIFNQTPKATLVTADYCIAMYQGIEGQRMHDLAWGTPQAKQVVLRFQAASNFAGQVFTVLLQEPTAAPPRLSYFKLCTFTVPINTTQTFTVVIPGPTTGTFYKDNIIGLWVYLYIAAGPDAVGGTEGSWQTPAGNFASPAGISNFFSQSPNAYFQFTNLGMYADPYKTGVAPPFEVPVEFDELRRCKRHWHRGQGYYGGVTSTSVASRMCGRHPVPMRVAPTAAQRGGPAVFSINTGQPPIVSVGNSSNEWSGDFDFTCSPATLQPTYAATMTWNEFNKYIELDARG